MVINWNLTLILYDGIELNFDTEDIMAQVRNCASLIYKKQ